eukprot:CAMPEP_0113883008 /NCGR_PEP_ID=MMETSP0780_2-20120614/9316_1 /TAXON_ID=652834 /ORGANISM="Palpitomonas bilix" /LENGTH=69 /DNA_ID=CAMNT_0000870175 /DNA_START=223 /DNA_END=432 /DNA_ORIENTATION=- /assembly_acc=CAM_ASM_000599
MGNEISYGGGGGGGGGGGPTGGGGVGGGLGPSKQPPPFSVGQGNSMFRSSNPSTAGGQIETMGGSTFQA